MSKHKIVVFTGSRYHTDKAIVRQAFRENINAGDAVIQGGCRGIDRAVYDVCRELSIHPITVSALWEKNGKAAGPMRNRFMLNFFKPDLVIGFPTKLSRGTVQCMEIAQHMGIQVKVYPV